MTTARIWECEKLSTPQEIYCRLLLGHAVNRPQASDDFVAAQPDDLAIREQVLQDAQGFGVVGIIEYRNQHDLVGDVEIRIARRQTRAFAINGARTRQSYDGQLFTVLILSVLETLVVFLQITVIVVLWVRFDDTHHCRWIDKSRDVVDMAVGIVADDTFAKPNHAIDSQRVLEILLNLGLI